MKSAMAFVVVVAVAATVVQAQGWSGLPRRAKRDTTANINDYMDEVIKQVATTLATNYDPIPLPEKYVWNFTVTDLLKIKWKSQLGVYDGAAYNATTIHRSGDATLSYINRTLDLDATVLFDRLVVTYHFVGKLLNIGPKGLFTVTVKNLQANLNIALNTKNITAELKNFSLDKAKSISVDVKGLGLLANWATEAFVNTFLLIFKGPILKTINKVIYSVFETVVSEVDPTSVIKSAIVS